MEWNNVKAVSAFVGASYALYQLVKQTRINNFLQLPKDMRVYVQSNANVIDMIVDEMFENLRRDHRPVVGFDIEWKPHRKGIKHRAALLQLCDGMTTSRCVHLYTWCARCDWCRASVFACAVAEVERFPREASRSACRRADCKGWCWCDE
jgi:hypothetical protein